MVTLALIGLGKWGQNYLHTVTSLKNTKIKYICAQNQQTLNLFSDSYIKVISINQLLENKNIDGFIVATSAKTHFAIAKQLLTLGCNLLIEKPLSINYGEALELQRIWQIKKPQVVVGHTYLYNPAYKVFKKYFKDIKVKSISFKGLSSPPRKDVSVIWDWGPHPISILIDLIKQPIVEVQAKGLIKNSSSNLCDTVKASIRFANGIKALIHISWFGSQRVRRLIAQGENEIVEFDDTNTTRQKIILHNTGQIQQYPTYPSHASLAKEVEEFTQAIQGRKKVISNLNMGVEVVKILSIIEQSVKNKGKPIKLERT